MMYADLEFYKNEFLQGKANVIPFTEFNHWITRATRYVNKHTYGRVKLVQFTRTVKKNVINTELEIETEETVELSELKEVAMATCAIAELYYSNEQLILKSKKSESVGNYSVSYSEDNNEKFNINLRTTLSDWLSSVEFDGVSILNRG